MKNEQIIKWSLLNIQSFVGSGFGSVFQPGFRQSEIHRAAPADREPRAWPAWGLLLAGSGQVGRCGKGLTQPANFTFPPVCCMGGQQWVLWAEVIGGLQFVKS